jgi:NAD(P)-dependent dehydrogenase (short-subunit alcohol dehydrogenase family)
VAPANTHVRDLFDLTDHAAIVTGGGTHLGRAMAEALAELGATVYLASRRGDLCEQVAAELCAAGLQARGAQVDVTDEASVDALVTRVMEERGRLDVLVANAGGSFARSYLPDASIDEFRRTYDLNVTGTYICAQAAARVMIPRRRGKIVTLGSIHSSLSADKRLYEGLRFKRSGPPYHAAKGAVLNLTRSLAAELAEWNIQVNCISPGHFPQENAEPTFVRRLVDDYPLGRLGTPQDLKGAVALLASRASDFMTGSNILVDGGFSIW